MLAEVVEVSGPARFLLGRCDGLILEVATVHSMYIEFLDLVRFLKAAIDYSR